MYYGYDFKLQIVQQPVFRSLQLYFAMPKKAAAKTGESSLKRECPHHSNADDSEGTSPKKQKTTGISNGSPMKKSAHLSHVLRVYKGLDDWHLPIFRQTKLHTGATKVLYPGSDKHVTASLIFPDVLYVDFNKKMKPIFEDPAVLQWVADHKEYDGDTQIKFEAKNFESKLCGEKTMDLLITACAGFVTKSCAKYVKPGGFVLASDAHWDARQMFVTKGFEFVGVFEGDALDTSEEGKTGHFMTTKGTPITKAQVEECAQKPKNKRSFKMVKEGMFYLFQRKE